MRAARRNLAAFVSSDRLPTGTRPFLSARLWPGAVRRLACPWGRSPPHFGRSELHARSTLRVEIGRSHQTVFDQVGPGPRLLQVGQKFTYCLTFTLFGLAHTEVKEARERVRAALQNSGLEFPHDRRHGQPGAG